MRTLSSRTPYERLAALCEQRGWDLQLHVYANGFGVVVRGARVPFGAACTSAAEVQSAARGMHWGLLALDGPTTLPTDVGDCHLRDDLTAWEAMTLEEWNDALTHGAFPDDEDRDDWNLEEQEED